MSGPSSVVDSIRQIPTAETIKAEHQIALVDQEQTPERDGEGVEEQEAEINDSEAPTAPTIPGPSLTQKLTRNSSQLQQSLKRHRTRRKYAKYDRDRYDIENGPPDENPANQPQIGEAATAAQTSYLERSRTKAKGFLKRKKTLGRGKDEQDAVIDILYENQRGIFFFGIPKYSSSSLLPSDPKPWQNNQFRTSPVDIRNAQVPDPSWEWAWKSWYVDMSRDVDEEGWEYSFQFAGNFAWHGNHPWFHSFVRRRRWLRMRRRRDTHHHTKEKAHQLTEEYFTIHPRTLRAPSEDFSKAASEMARLSEKFEEEVEIEKMDVSDIASLMRVLKKAAVDREKLVAVRKFVGNGGEELYYLADRMPEIMNLFVFQSSRRQLLADLLHRFDDAHKRREDLTERKHEDEDTQEEHDAATRQAENLMNAVKVADDQVKKLEYWSDIKGMSHRGETLQEASEGHWDLSKWQGLSPNSGEDHPEDTFASKQAASEGVQALHPYPEHVGGEASESEAAPRKKSSVWFDAKENKKEISEDTEHELYSTPAQSTSELPLKGARKKSKGRSSRLDGVYESDEAEEEEEGEEEEGEEEEGEEEEGEEEEGEEEEGEEEEGEEEEAEATSSGARQASVPDIPVPRKQSVQIIEPVPEETTETTTDRTTGGVQQESGAGDSS